MVASEPASSLPQPGRRWWTLIADTFSLWSSHLPLMVAISALAWVPYYLLVYLVGASIGGPLYAVLTIIGPPVVLALTQAAVAPAVEQIQQGSTPSLRDAYSRALSKLPALLLATLLICLAMLAIMVPVLLVAVLLRGTGALLPLLMVLAGLVLIFLFFVRIAVVAQVIILEDNSATGGLRRAWDLQRGNFLRTIALLLVLGVLGFVVTLVASVPARLATDAGAVLALQTLGVAVATALIGALVPVGLTLLYLSIRR